MRTRYKKIKASIPGGLEASRARSGVPNAVRHTATPANGAPARSGAPLTAVAGGNAETGVPTDAKSIPRAGSDARARCRIPVCGLQHPPGGLGRSPVRGARSYPMARGRTRRRAVVPDGARSYLRGALRYDRAARGTTWRGKARPRGPGYDLAWESTTARAGVRPGVGKYDRAARGTTWCGRVRPRGPGYDRARPEALANV